MDFFHCFVSIYLVRSPTLPQREREWERERERESHPKWYSIWDGKPYHLVLKARIEIATASSLLQGQSIFVIISMMFKFYLAYFICFCQIHYDRVGKDGFFSHKEVTVFYVPNLSECLPSLDQWRGQWLTHKEKTEREEVSKEKVIFLFVSEICFSIIFHMH